MRHRNETDRSGKQEVESETEVESKRLRKRDRSETERRGKHEVERVTQTEGESTRLRE